MNQIEANAAEAIRGMGWDEFLALCVERGERPSKVLRDAGL